MKITISNATVYKKSGVSKKGTNYEFFWQEAEADCPRFRQPVNISVRDDKSGYAPGAYEMDTDAFIKVDGFREFETERFPVLKAVAAK